MGSPGHGGYEMSDGMDITARDIALAQRGTNMICRYISDLYAEGVGADDQITVLYGVMEAIVDVLLAADLPKEILVLTVLNMSANYDRERSKGSSN